MKQSLALIMGFVKKEFSQALRDPVMKFFIFGAPLIQLTIFGYAIDNEFKNLKLAVYSNPVDVSARMLTDAIYASNWFVPVEPEGRPEDMLTARGVDAVLVMPQGGAAGTSLTEAIANQQGTIQLLVDASNATKARAVNRYIAAIVQQFVRTAQYSGSRAPLPVTFDLRVLFNPTMQTSIFMVPGIMTLIMSLITIIMTSMSLAREKELGTFETIIAAPIQKWEIIVGKAVPFMILGFLDALLILTAGILLFDVPVRGPLVALVVATVVYVMTTVSIGILVSSVAENQQQAMMGTFMFEFPAILLSGVMFPVENMPLLVRLVAYCNPLMYYVNVVRDVMLKGGNPEVVLSCTAVLAGICVVVMIATITRFKQKLN